MPAGPSFTWFVRTVYAIAVVVVDTGSRKRLPTVEASELAVLAIISVKQIWPHSSDGTSCPRLACEICQYNQENDDPKVRNMLFWHPSRVHEREGREWVSFSFRQHSIACESYR